MSFRVVFSPEAADQLVGLFRDVAAAASPQVAKRYTEALIRYCEGLATFPLRGTKQDDIRPGLRVVGYKKRVAIAFTVEDDLVQIIGVFYRGQNFEAALRSNQEDETN